MKTSLGIWWKAWESTVQANWSWASLGQAMAGRHRLRQNGPEEFWLIGNIWHNTDWVPLNKNPECPECKPEVWIIPVCVWMQRELWDTGWNPWLLQSTEERVMLCWNFMINMQHLATILEHLPCFCKWAPNLYKRPLQLWMLLISGNVQSMKISRAMCRRIFGISCSCLFFFSSPLTCSGPWLEGIARAPSLWFSSTYYFIFLQYQNF